MVSDRPRDQESEARDAQPADAPVTGPPGGANPAGGASTPRATRPAGGYPAGGTITPGRGASTPGREASTPAGGTSTPGAGTSTPGVAGPAGGASAAGRGSRPVGASAARGSQAPGEQSLRQRRRRRFVVAGIVAGAAVVVITLCAGTLSIVSAVDGYRDRAAEVRETRELRDADCLSLEQRLNRLTPPGAAGSPAARAVAIRDENAAVRIYVNALRDRRNQDGWRQLLDARTAYAEALDLQAKAKTPAFYVPPRAPDGVAVSDQLIEGSPEPCAAPVRRLAVPDL